jgi:hypothetical protein
LPRSAVLTSGMSASRWIVVTLAGMVVACGDDGGRSNLDASQGGTIGSIGDDTDSTGGDTTRGTGDGSASASATSTDGTSADTTGGVDDGTTTTATTTTTEGTTGPGEDDGDPTGNVCPLQCSADLHQVLDCNRTVVTQCNEDQGCFDGVCIDNPCEAAELAESSVGCDYWSVKTDLINEGSGACFAAFVANTWSGPAHLEVEWQGQPLPVQDFVRIPQGQGQNLTYGPYDPNQGLPPGEVAIVFLSRGAGFLPACPSPPALNQETQVPGTGYGNAFNIRSDRPVIAYQMLPYGGGSVAATSATLLLPTSVWDDNYLAINAYPKSQAVFDAQPSMNIVAHEDGTEVTLLPVAAIAGGGGVPAAPANQPVTYNLNRGQHLQLSQNVELTGSPIMANKPVGVFGGASCLNVKVNDIACDSAHQQIPPVNALGNRYVGVRYRNRAAAVGEETPPWRVIGLVDGTMLSWDPAAPAGAPAMLNQGDVYEFDSAGGWVVSSQDEDHPFYVGAYMTGGAAFNGEGDPEWVNVVPVDQYLDRYVFFTDPTFPETNLVVVRRQDGGVFHDVSLDCAGPLQGWQAIGPYEFTRVNLVTGNFQDVGNCSNGRHEMWSDAPFGVTVWGWGSTASTLFTQYVSYAYPAGLSLQQINDVVIIPQ